MNCLVLDPKTVIVEASEVYQQEQMDKLGMNVIPCDLRDAYPFGGGPALLHGRRLPRGRLPRLLPEPRQGSHPGAPRDVERLVAQHDFVLTDSTSLLR